MAVKTFTNEQLTASDTNTYLANAGLVWIATATASGTARSLAIDNCFTSTYANYRVVGKLRSTVNGNNLFFQLYNSTGSALSANYYGTAYGQDYATPGTGFSTVSGTTVAYVGWIPNSTSIYLHFAFDVYSPRISADCTSWNGLHTGISSGVAYLGGALLGARTTADENRGLVFDNGGAGNLTGSVSVYGYRTS